MKNHKCEIMVNRGIEMNTREIAAEYRLSHWARITQDRKESGLNVTAYCKTIGIHPNTYFYWQRKLREAVNVEILQLPANYANQKIKTAPPGWAICEIKKPEPNESAVYIEIGVNRVKVTTGSDPELITKACRALIAL